MEDRMRTNARERAHVRMMIELDRLEQDVRDARLRGALIPGDWRGLETTAPVTPRKKKVTVALDDELDTRINAVFKARPADWRRSDRRGGLCGAASACWPGGLAGGSGDRDGVIPLRLGAHGRSDGPCCRRGWRASVSLLPGRSLSCG